MPISQAEFARRRNVSRARVSQWVKEGKISGDALVAGQIDELLACQQLGQKLDIDQRHSGNGLKTNLQPVGEAPPPLALPLVDTVESRIAQERLTGLQYSNRDKAKAEEIANGRLCDVADARAATVQQTAQLIARLEGALPEMATRLSAQFKLPQRDVLHALRAIWRDVRQAAAIEAYERAEPMPQSVGYEIET